MPLVKIKPGLSHAHYSAGEVFDATPAEVESFGDKFILVVEDEPEPGPEPPVTSLHSSATRGAIALATEHGISLPLSGITGTGQSKRITKADVQRLLNGDAQR